MTKEKILSEVKMHQKMATYHSNEATRLLEKLSEEAGAATTASPRKGLDAKRKQQLRLDLRKSLYKSK